jgi:hypothetical protein
MNTAFITYKKRQLFNQVIQTVNTMQKMKEDQEKAELERQRMEEMKDELMREAAKQAYQDMLTNNKAAH